MTFHRNRHNTGELGLTKSTKSHAKVAAERREEIERAFTPDEFTAKLRRQVSKDPAAYWRKEAAKAAALRANWHKTRGLERK